MSLGTVHENVYAALSGHSGIQALVANSDSPVTYRIDPLQRGQAGTDPFVVYQQIYDSAFNVLNNAGGGGKRRVRMQVTSFSPTHAGAYALAEQVRQAMRDASTFTSAYMMSIDGFDPDTKLYSVVSDFSVMTF